jgi:hypothetical protein
MDVLKKTALGFVVMGFIGFFVKLLFIVSALWRGSDLLLGAAPAPF